MAVASGELHPHAFFEAGWTAYSSKLYKNWSVETSTDSDDDYDYVASLAEQIAHAMLDEEDCCEDAHQNFFMSCSPSNFELQDTMHDPRLCNSKTSKDSQSGISPNILSTSTSLPLTREYSARLSSDQFEKAPDCKFAATDTALRASLHCELAFNAHGGSENSQLLKRESPPHSRQQIQEAFVPLSQRQPSNAGRAPATSVSLPTSCSDSSFQGVRHYNDWQRGGREHSNSRSRHGVRRKHDSAKNVRPVLYHAQASQANAPRRQSPLQDLRDSAGAHTTSLGHSPPPHSPVRAEPIGTGVFLPRIAFSGSNHRRKAESATALSKATQSTNDTLFRGGRHRERVHLHRISTAP